jgi:hypothetical protein
MLFNIFNRKFRDLDVLFSGHYVDVKCYYVMRFNEIPCTGYMGELDTTLAYAHVQEHFGGLVAAIYQHSYWDYNEQQLLANNTVLVLKKKKIIEFTESYCQVFYSPQEYEWSNRLLNELAAYRIVKENRIIGFATSSQMN